MTVKQRFIHILKNLDAYFAGFMFAITLTLVVVNVFTRYCLNYIIPWGEEIATSCFVYTTFVGGAWCLRTRQLVGVDMLVERLPYKAARIVNCVTDFIILFLNAYLTKLSYQYTYKGRIKTMPITKVSSVWLNSAMIIGFGLMTIYSVYNLYKSIKAVNAAPAANKEEKEV